MKSIIQSIPMIAVPLVVMAALYTIFLLIRTALGGDERFLGKGDTKATTWLAIAAFLLVVFTGFLFYWLSR